MEHLYQKLKLWEDSSMPLSENERLDAAVVPLCFWYQKFHRELPWRENKDPYRIWISEIMLQQTRVEAVKPYFIRFLKILPDISVLANVEEEVLLKLWEGLGYYSRARNLKKTAQICEELYAGKLPESYEELIKLPGIGSYTAGAIASIAYGIKKPAVDGNVLRVVHRILACRDDILQAKVKKSLEGRLEKSMQRTNADAGIYNQALMELGACICIPNGEPLCAECPLSQICLAHKQGVTDEIPYRPKKKQRRIETRTVFIVTDGDHFVIRKRPSKGLLAGLFELPAAEGRLSGKEVCEWWEKQIRESVNAAEIKSGKHIFSHVEWQMSGWEVRTEKRLTEYRKQLEDQGYLIVTKDEIRDQYPVPGAFSSWKEYWEKESER